MGVVLVWPQRQRCRRCRNFWPEPWILGMFCSYECAGVVGPPADPAEAPRACRTKRRGGGWRWKRRWPRLEDIPARNLNEPRAQAYLCDCCHMWHVGHREAARWPIGYRCSWVGDDC